MKDPMHILNILFDVLQEELPGDQCIRVYERFVENLEQFEAHLQELEELHDEML